MSDERHAPIRWQNSQDVLELVDGSDLPSRKRDHFVIDTKTAAIRVQIRQNLTDHGPAMFVRTHGGAEGRMVDNPAAFQGWQEIPDLIDRDRIGET